MPSISVVELSSIVIFVIIRFSSCAFKPAVLVSEKNGEVMPENVYIDFLECTPENLTNTQIQESDEAEKLREQVAKLNHSMEAANGEILKMKQDISAFVLEQLKTKDLTIQSLIEKNAIITFELEAAKRELVNRTGCTINSTESMYCISVMQRKL